MKYINKEKLEKLNINSSNLVIVLDFDRTITASNSMDSWDASGLLLGNDFKEKLEKLYIKYRPIELDYKISKEEKARQMEKWYKECLDLYEEYKLNKQELEESVKKSKLIFRKGAKEFLNNAIEKEIPVVILSAGIGNVIEMFLKKNNVLGKNFEIISNFLQFDEKGNIKPFKGKLIHTTNKELNIIDLRKDFKEELISRKYRILVGDMIEDEKMVSRKEWDRTMKIAFLDISIKENIELYKNSFDIVLTNEDSNFDKIREIFPAI